MRPLPVLLETGSSESICFAECGHVECKRRHATARSLCRICQRSIGYFTGFRLDPQWEGYVHNSCASQLGDLREVDAVAA